MKNDVTPTSPTEENSVGIPVRYHILYLHERELLMNFD